MGALTLEVSILFNFTAKPILGKSVTTNEKMIKIL